MRGTANASAAHRQSAASGTALQRRSQTTRHASSAPPPRPQAISRDPKRSTSTSPVSTPPAAEPRASSRYTAPPASPAESAVCWDHHRLPAANSAPSATQMGIGTASETSSMVAGPRLSPGTVWSTGRAARTATTAQGSAAARVASQTRIRMRGRAAALPANPLPTAVQASQHASTSPMEISFPRKTTINSRRSTTWAMAAVKPIWTLSARTGNPALTPTGLDAAFEKSKREAKEAHPPGSRRRGPWYDIYVTRRSGGIGRRNGLKIRRSSLNVWVRPPPSPP